MNELVAISYSTWSEKARWALDHQRIPYVEKPYLPMLGEPALRARLGQWSGRVSVPILFADARIIRESYAIATFADESGSGPTLFPSAHKGEIREWNDKSEIAMAAGRAMASQRVLDDPAAKREALPKIPGKALMTPLANLAVGYLRRKYDFSDSLEPQRKSLEEVLRHLQSVTDAGAHYLVGGQFSYADICMASALQCVRPVTDEYIKLGPATRKAWTDEGLANKYASLLGWRDQLYQERRIRQP